MLSAVHAVVVYLSDRLLIRMLIKMATSLLVFSNPLCFLISRFGKIPDQQLKCVVSDFYNTDDLVAAKQQLFEDVKSLNLTVDIPLISSVRESAARTAHVIDDIFAVLTCLNENLCLGYLPKYVAKGPDFMLFTCLCNGNLAVLLEKMSDRMSECGSTVATIFSELLSVKEQVKLLSTTVSLARTAGAGDGAGDGNRGYKQPVSHVSNSTSSALTLGSSHGNSVQIDNISETETTHATSSAVPDWAALASTPILLDNRYSVLQSTDDECRDEYSERPFEEQRSARVKRRRQLSSQQHQQPVQRQQQQGGNDQQQSARRSRAPLMVGKSAASGASVAAAKQMFKKSVFLVDNVSTKYVQC